MLTERPTIIEAIRNPDLFDSLFKTQEYLGCIDCVAKGRVWVEDGSRRATDKIRARRQSKDAKQY